MRVLYTSQAIRKEIQRMFHSTIQRRVAIAAYVGDGALAHLPKPKGLEVYCWPHAGGTSADAVDALRARKARVFFADRVHMKVYWAEKMGALITSANLSDNAFGIGGLREAGVAIAADDVDIERLINSLHARPAKRAEIEKLRAKQPDNGVPHVGSAKVHIPTFANWYDGTGGMSWKWDYYDSFGGGPSARARSAAKEIDPSYSPVDFIYCKRGKLEEEDWVLRVRVTAEGILINPEWVYVERVVLVEKRDRFYNSMFPFQAVQARESRHCPPPPFLVDSRFKKALRSVSLMVGEEKVGTQVDSRRPTSSFLKKLRAAY